MWIVKIITFIEYHPYFVLCLILVTIAVVRFFWREYRRPSYRQQKEFERFLHGFEEDRQRIDTLKEETGQDAQEKPKKNE